MYPYKDSSGDDLYHLPNIVPAECADLCYVAGSCVGFVISPWRDCWIKKVITTSNLFVNRGDRTVVKAGDKNCQGLFTT
ncbi:hypothetical protein Mapa_012785 [Marchantia paleacea]|nr:hypothetical protein Mapa_012785 [Marchantia paleacea]